MIAGIQISSFKPLLTSSEQVRNTFQKVKDMGCDTVQLQWINTAVPITAIASALKDSSLTAVSVQEMFPDFDINRSYYYELCRACNCEELCLSRIPSDCTDINTLKCYADTLTQIHNKLQQEGRHLSFHPTKNDYLPINGVSKLDILMQFLPESVTLCLDLYHVERAGLSLAETLHHYGSRVTEVHFKDYQILPDGNEILVPAGYGSIRWNDAITACLEQGVTYAFVEQERWERDPFDCLEEAFHWLRTQLL